MTGLFEKRSHLHTKLDTGIVDGRDLPLLGFEVVFLPQGLVKSNKVIVYGLVVLPPQQQHGYVGIWGSLGLPLDQHGGILEMAGKRLEVVAFDSRSIMG